MLTVISDVQNVVNSRPLTCRSSNNILETITPNCFLKADPNGNVILRFDEDPIWERDPTSRDTLTDALSARDELLSHFKELWYNSYLLSLREICSDLHQVNWNDKIPVDDIVLVKLLNKSRPYWVLGRVIELIRGHDDKIRSVKGRILLDFSVVFEKFHFSFLLFLWVRSGLSWHVLKYFYDIRKNKKVMSDFSRYFLCIFMIASY